MASYFDWLAYPQALMLLLALPLLVSLTLLNWVARRRAWRLLGNRSPTKPFRRSRRFWRGLLVTFGLLLIGIAVAGPRWGREQTTVFSAGRDLVVVLDVSRSMLAEVPSRQQR